MNLPFHRGVHFLLRGTFSYLVYCRDAALLHAVLTQSKQKDPVLSLSDAERFVFQDYPSPTL